MAKLVINPTRIELLKLKKKLKTAKHGYNLLKDKRDGLMKEFLKIIEESKILRKKVEKEIQNVFENFIFASAQNSPEELEEALMIPEKKIILETKTKNVMGVNMPEFIFKEEGDFLCYSPLSTPSDLDEILSVLSNTLKDLVKLAQVEHSAKLLALEIEKTRRRVNALEYVFIPNIEETIKYIENKLIEQERGMLISLIQIKKEIS